MKLYGAMFSRSFVGPEKLLQIEQLIVNEIFI
jgi:hypothetical protein